MNLRQMIDLQSKQGDLTRFNNRKTYLQAGGPGSGRHKGNALDELHNVAIDHGFTHTSGGTGTHAFNQYSHPSDDSKLGTFGDGSWRHTASGYREKNAGYGKAEGNGASSLAEHLGTIYK